MSLSGRAGKILAFGLAITSATTIALSTINPVLLDRLILVLLVV